MDNRKNTETEITPFQAVVLIFGFILGISLGLWFMVANYSYADLESGLIIKQQDTKKSRSDIVDSIVITTPIRMAH